MWLIVTVNYLVNTYGKLSSHGKLCYVALVNYVLNSYGKLCSCRKLCSFGKLCSYGKLLCMISVVCTTIINSLLSPLISHTLL